MTQPTETQDKLEERAEEIWCTVGGADPVEEAELIIKCLTATRNEALEEAARSCVETAKSVRAEAVTLNDHDPVRKDLMRHVATLRDKARDIIGLCITGETTNDDD